MLKGKNLSITLTKSGSDILVQVSARGITSPVVNMSKRIAGASDDPSKLDAYMTGTFIEDLKNAGAYVAERAVNQVTQVASKKATAVK